jgi:uncharacterized protein YeaO (DUF488 family)
MSEIRTKRAYDPSEPGDGARLLVERLWPRGLTKAEVAIDRWLKDVAPSTTLRRWYGHDPAKWEEFRQRYVAELDGEPEAWQPILDAARHGPVTLVYSAKDTEHNSAVALTEYLEEHLGTSAAGSKAARRV